MYIPDTGVANAKKHDGISNCMREDRGDETKTAPYLKTMQITMAKA